MRIAHSCARCTKRMETQIVVPVEVLVRLRQASERPGEEEPEGVIFYDGERFSLLDEVRQAILVEAPTVTLCRADCPGLCPHCGADLNTQRCDCDGDAPVDPRWAALYKAQVDAAADDQGN